MPSSGKLKRIRRNPAWYAGTVVSRARNALFPHRDVSAQTCFTYVGVLVEDGILQPARTTSPSRVPTHFRDVVPDGPRGSLVELLDQKGSDKGSRHGYGEIYEDWLTRRDATDVRVLVEVGLGSPAALTPSNMGPEARPGASITAFAEFLPWAIALGVDIDSRSFPSDERIECFEADQLRSQSFGLLIHRLSQLGGFDFAVVDGLHTPEADLNSLIILLPWLREQGVLFIEDLGDNPETIECWRSLLGRLQSPYSGQLHWCQSSFLAMIERSASLP